MTTVVYSKDEIDVLLGGAPPPSTGTVTREPWIAYGQQAGPSGAHIDNPVCNHTGAIGEVDLPYTVPVGWDLVLTAWGIEAYESITGSFVLVPWIGDAPATNAKCLHSVLASTASGQTHGFEYRFPAGTQINARIMCSEAGNPVAGWFMSGYKIAVE